MAFSPRYQPIRFFALVFVSGCMLGALVRLIAPAVVDRAPSEPPTSPTIGISIWTAACLIGCVDLAFGSLRGRSSTKIKN